ncbi:hypothetical protein BDV93DRAFT_562018 [Ceratobasidium sp. AG-I]|nr:hypothetical protein BDV93DRAFT_562018 [Ceratobasidium sp. AG-I]
MFFHTPAMSFQSLRESSNRSSARSTSVAAIAREVDPEDEDLILYRRRRLIPLTKSPFYDKDTIEYRKLREQRRHGPGSPMPTSGDVMSTYAGMLTADEIKDSDENNDEERGERPPAWLDLFYDLAWASTFSNLTQNTMILGFQETLSYAVFFSMVWWMWVSQVSYDIRFYSNDWFHRCFVFLQLCVFGSLSAFTNNFDVTAYIGSDESSYIETTLANLQGVSLSQQAANRAASNRIPQLSFFGIALVIGVSRVLLFLQYLRVWIYAHDKRDPAILVKPLTMLLSCGLWFGSFTLLNAATWTSDVTQVSKFIMWGVAIAIEVAGDAFAPLPSHLRSMGSLTARLATLVTIILGEGLNGITGTLKFEVQSLGFNCRSAGLVFATAVVVYRAYCFLPFNSDAIPSDRLGEQLCSPVPFYHEGANRQRSCLVTFYLYFESTCPRISKNRRALWICLHLPYMLCVILLMEGLKNLLLYAILFNSYKFVITTFNKNIDMALEAPPRQFFDVLNSTMTPFLAQIGISWETAWKPVHDALVDMNSTTGHDRYYIEIYRLLMNITVEVFDSFDSENISPSGRVAVLRYLQNDSLPLGDKNAPDGLPNFMNASVVNVLAEPQVSGARWISAVAGGTLILLACINVAQSWPKDRYSWGSVLSRLITGLILLALLLLNINSGDYRMDESAGDATVWAWLDSYWVLPTLALSFIAQAIVDHALRSADRAVEQTYRPTMLDPLRDAKDHAYDPLIAASHLPAMPTTNMHIHGNHAGSWQHMYVPLTLGYVETSPPQRYASPESQH